MCTNVGLCSRSSKFGESLHHCRTLHTLHHNDGGRCRTASVIPTSLPACLPRLPEDACSSRALASLGFYHVLAVMMTTTRILLLAVSSSAFRRLPLPQQHSGLPRLRQRAPRVRANGRGRGTATEGPTPSSYSRQNISSWNLVLTINNSDKSHDHLVKGQTVKVRKTSSLFFCYWLTHFLTRFFKSLSNVGRVCLLTKHLPTSFFVCLFVGVQNRVRSSFTWEIRYPFFANYLTIMARSMISLLLSTAGQIYSAAYILK